ncbi:hypothetical protein [uncultured Paraglaciecola sp.]|uniref:hypothetical protein n=1 Tax=uncultured Paraglaciecola sp. TaxID=1765024 RepID=UPI00260A2052|nr:hypothetical protein [uncultured Paraglaciecola sp.]
MSLLHDTDDLHHYEIIECEGALYTPRYHRKMEIAKHIIEEYNITGREERILTLGYYVTGKDGKEVWLWAYPEQRDKVLKDVTDRMLLEDPKVREKEREIAREAARRHGIY